MIPMGCEPCSRIWCGSRSWRAGRRWWRRTKFEWRPWCGLVDVEICTSITHNINRSAYIRTYVRTYIHFFIHSYIHTFIRTYIHTLIHTYIQTDRQTDIQTDRQTYIHTYIPLHYVTLHYITHTHIYIYIDTQKCVLEDILSCDMEPPVLTLSGGDHRQALQLANAARCLGGLRTTAVWNVEEDLSNKTEKKHSGHLRT